MTGFRKDCRKKAKKFLWLEKSMRSYATSGKITVIFFSAENNISSVVIVLSWYAIL